MNEHKRFIHRTLNVSASEYEKGLAKALIGIPTRGIHDLDGIVASLNETDVASRSGGKWTAPDFVVEIERLAAAN
jgi:Recombinase-like helix-turn-helix domain